MQSMDFLVQHSLLNSVRTGDPAKDAIISVIVLTVITGIMAFVKSSWETVIKPFLKQIYDKIKARFFNTRSKEYVYRIINFKYKLEKFGDQVPYNSRNERDLQSAILDAIKKTKPKYQTANVHLDSGFLHWYDRKINELPKNGNWYEVSPGVELNISESKGDDESETPAKDSAVQIIHQRIFTIRCLDEKTLTDYISSVWDAYRLPHKKVVETENATVLPKYFYMLTLNSEAAYEKVQTNTATPAAAAGNDKTSTVSKRPALFDAHVFNIATNSTTFDCMFFPNKKRLLAKLDDFMFEKESPHREPGHINKFSVKGCPRKLGFLLHGPPGTGKTSFARALAAYTGRHIVTIAMNEIRSPNQLFQFFHNLEMNVHGNKIHMGPKECVIVLDEVDSIQGLRDPKFQTAEITEDSDSDSDSKSCFETDEVEPETEQKKSAKKKSEHEIKDAMKHIFKKMIKRSARKEVNGQIEAWLTALDGIIESQGRLMVMTTNHREWLHPALLRPGRVDMDILFTHMTHEDICSLICMYFSPADTENPNFNLLTAQQRQRLTDLPCPVTPADVQNECISQNTIDEVIARLESKKQKN